VPVVVLEEVLREELGEVLGTALGISLGLLLAAVLGLVLGEVLGGSTRGGSAGTVGSRSDSQASQLDRHGNLVVSHFHRRDVGGRHRNCKSIGFTNSFHVNQITVPGETLTSPLWIVARVPANVAVIRAWTAQFSHTSSRVVADVGLALDAGSAVGTNEGLEEGVSIGIKVGEDEGLELGIAEGAGEPV
jgi:hypothetical protein